jgi:hypothetical protein
MRKLAFLLTLFLAACEQINLDGQILTLTVAPPPTATPPPSPAALTPTASPDGAQTALTRASAARARDLASTSLARFEAATLKQQRLLLSEDLRALETSAWDADNVLTLRGRAGGVWYLDLATGVISQ